MKLNHFSLNKIVLVLLSLALVVSVVFLDFPTSATSAFSLSSTPVDNGYFTVTLSFPNVTWGGFQFVLTYDHTAVQLTQDPDMPSSKPTIYSAPSSVGNNSGSVTIGGGGFADITASGVVISMPFRVVNSSASETEISVSVTKFILFNNTPVSHTAPTPITVSLNPHSSTDTGSGGGGSSSTDGPGGGSDGGAGSSGSSGGSNVGTPTPSDSSSSTVTDGPTSDPTDTPTNTSQKTDTASTNTKTDSQGNASQPSHGGTGSDVVDSGTGSDAASDSQPGSETDSALSDMDTDSASGMTDSSGGASDGTSDGFSHGSSGTRVPGGSTSTNGSKKTGALSTGTIVLISVGISVVLCGALTALGLLRRKKSEE